MVSSSLPQQGEPSVSWYWTAIFRQLIFRYLVTNVYWERTDEREKHHLVQKIIRLCGKIFTTSLFCGQSPIYAECFFETLRFPFLSCLSLFFIPTKILKGKLVKMETFGNSFKRGVLKKSHRFENALFLEWILVSGGGGKAFLRYRP